jgi:hypothetical protein
MLKGEVFPADDVNVAEMLDAFASRGFIIRYSAGGKKLIQIVSFHGYQRPDHNERKSVLPAPDGWTEDKCPGNAQATPRQRPGKQSDMAGEPLECQGVAAPVIRYSGDPVLPVEESLSPRDPSAAATKPAVRRPNGCDLIAWFGLEREKAFEGALSWVTPRNADGDAETFAQKLPEDSFADVRSTMAAFFAHVKAGDSEWNNPKNKDPSFAFGSWKSGFTALREELHGRAPMPRAGPRGSPPRKEFAGYDPNWQEKLDAQGR